MLDAALFCLSLNIYHEARSEPVLGQVLVAQVTMNRVHNEKFPNTVCNVVMQHKQFSWTAEKIERVRDKYGRYVGLRLKQGMAPKEHKAWIKSVRIAKAALEGKYEGITEALYYHKANIKPFWSFGREFAIASVGNHLFFDKSKSRLSYNINSTQKKREV